MINVRSIGPTEAEAIQLKEDRGFKNLDIYTKMKGG